MSDIIVVGSINIDMIVNVDKRPAKGETVLGKNFFTSPGGKGANQAFAAAKLAADVAFVGVLGEDAFKERLLEHLKGVNINTDYLKISSTSPTGTALITVDQDGDNSIVVAPNANSELSPEYLKEIESIFEGAKLLIVQLETPLEMVIEAVKMAKKHGLKVLLDPAPVQELPDDLYQHIDFITPNQMEMEQLTHVEVKDMKSARVAATKLLEKGVKTVFAKMGEKGVTVVNSSITQHIKSFRVEAVDTTAAGDAFAGAVGSSLVKDGDVFKAGYFGSAVAAR